MIAVEARFWLRVTEADNGCWLWTGATNGVGYGVTRDLARRSVLAHRVAYEQLVTDIPDGLEIDHLCRVRNCVNPWHLEPVTHAENMRRRPLVTPTHCPRGHVYTPVSLSRTRPTRRCLDCERGRWAKQAAARKAQRASARTERAVR